MNEELDPEDTILMFINSSGFAVVPVQAIVDALAEMENQIMQETGLSREELEDYLKKVEELVGKQEALHLQIDEIVGWIRAIRGF